MRGDAPHRQAGLPTAAARDGARRRPNGWVEKLTAHQPALPPMPAAAVLAPLDLSEDPGPALLAAADLAERTGAALHLLHARSTPQTYTAPSDPDAGFRARVEVLVDQSLGPGSCVALQPLIHVVHGDSPAHATLELAGQLQPYAVVLGTHGRRGFQRFVLGSVAEEVIRKATCPVLAVPHTAEHATPSPERPVLVPTDLSDFGTAALRAGAEHAARYDAPLIALHVAAPEVIDVPGVYLVLGDPVMEADRARAGAKAAVVRHIAEAGVQPAETIITGGFPDEAIDRVARQRQAGCVVMGTHGRTGIGRALVGSVTESVLRGAPCAVLAVPLPD